MRRSLSGKRWICAVTTIALAWAIGCGDDDAGSEAVLPLLVLAAIPAELDALLEHMDVVSEQSIAGRTFRSGSIGGTAVLVGMTGIGLVNAAVVASAVLDAVPVRGVVVSGVAGAPWKIGDVAVPDRWRTRDGPEYAVDRAWLAAAEEAVVAGAIVLDRCTERPDEPSAPDVCIVGEPIVATGGVGRSSDPFGGMALACVPSDDETFGCDATGRRSSDQPRAVARHAKADAAQIAAGDMETAAIAAEAAVRGLPFIAFRAVSDGDGDPLGLPGFPAQFFAYYRLASRNAAAATASFLARLA